MKERSTFRIFGILFGAVGMHNFYAGYTGKAIAQLLITVCTLGIGSAITIPWSIIEACTITKDASGNDLK